MAQPTSPRFSAGTAPLNLLVDSKVETSRSAVKAELGGRIVYNESHVFRRLRVGDVNNDFVAACAGSFVQDNEADINLLVDLAKGASRKPNEDLEQEEITNKAGDADREERSGNHGSAEERKMYEPLARLCDYITSFGRGTTPYRKFQQTKRMLKPDEPHTFGFTSCSPDFTITKPGSDASQSKLWRDRDAFLEVKPSKNQRPKEGTIAQVVAQCADYARLFMSARPFMLFCVGILVFGTEFCVGIFDRDGITFSPVYDMFKDMACFIRLVRSVSHLLTTTELGSDPTVRVLDDSETQRLTGGRTYPSAIVSAIGNDAREWCTIGPPIWSSVSFLGCGTNVWRVRQYIVDPSSGRRFLQGNEMIMKTAWRSSARVPESYIYRSIRASFQGLGLARFECGDDVCLDGWPVTVQNLRSQPVLFPLPENDRLITPVLHRLILSTIGRPMWQYSSDHELLTAFRDALIAHKWLCEQRILHRDISPGNVLISANPNYPYRGFITDLDLAHVERETLLLPNVVETVVGPQKRLNDRGNVIPGSLTSPVIHRRIKFDEVGVQRGAVMTGTIQFMALELLLQAARGSPVPHEKKHDIESFIWVFCYCVMRNLYVQASQCQDPAVQAERKELRKIFSDAFSQTTPSKIASMRFWGSQTLDFVRFGKVGSIIKQFMSQTLVDLFKALQRLVQIVQADIGQDLTHELLLKEIDKAIASLE